MSQRDHVLQLDNITMQFGGVVAVNNLSMEVNEGEIVALIGSYKISWPRDCSYARPHHQDGDR